MNAKEVEKLETMMRRWEKDCTPMWDCVLELEIFIMANTAELDEWMPIESLPKDGTFFDAWDNDGNRHTNTVWLQKEGYFIASDGWLLLTEDIFCWKPTPKPPEALSQPDK